MMDDALYGQRDRRGNWKPVQARRVSGRVCLAPAPTRHRQGLFSYPSYVLPWNLLYAAIAAGIWLYLTPPIDTLKTFAPGWVAFVFAQRGSDLPVLRRVPSTALHPQSAGQSVQVQCEVADTDNPTFLFRDQTTDNMIWTLASGVPIWTA